MAKYLAEDIKRRRASALDKCNRNHPQSPHRRRDQRRDEAIVRQHAYESLSLVEKIALAEKRRGASQKELNKLRALLDA